MYYKGFNRAMVQAEQAPSLFVQWQRCFGGEPVTYLFAVLTQYREPSGNGIGFAIIIIVSALLQ